MNLFELFSGMVSNLSDRVTRYVARRVHPTKKGPSRSQGMNRYSLPVGRKLAKKAFLGTLGLRGRNLGAAARLAQQNNWK